MNPRITINPSVLHGKPVITGTRVPVSQILAELSLGRNYDEIISDYPNITKEDIFAALDFGSELAQFETIEIGIQ